MRLLLISCSDTKTKTPGATPAILRYDGPKYRVLRRALEGGRLADLRIRILSGKHGWISADTPISDYDHLAGRSQILAHCAWGRAKSTYAAIDMASDIFVMAGEPYVDGIRHMLTGSPATFATGAPGQRLKRLKEWLERK